MTPPPERQKLHQLQGQRGKKYGWKSWICKGCPPPQTNMNLYPSIRSPFVFRLNLDRFKCYRHSSSPSFEKIIIVLKSSICLFLMPCSELHVIWEGVLSHKPALKLKFNVFSKILQEERKLICCVFFSKGELCKGILTSMIRGEIFD